MFFPSLIQASPATSLRQKQHQFASQGHTACCKWQIQDLKPDAKPQALSSVPRSCLLRLENPKWENSSGRRADWLVGLPGKQRASCGEHRYVFLAGTQNHSALEGRRLATWTRHWRQEIESGLDDGWNRKPSKRWQRKGISGRILSGCNFKGWRVKRQPVMKCSRRTQEPAQVCEM